MNDNDYQAFRQSVFDYLWNELDPLVAAIEATNHIEWQALFPGFRDHGLFGLVTPEEYGGVDLTISQYLPILGELSKLHGGFRAAIHVHNTTARAVAVFGTEAQKATYLPKLARGESSIAFCLTEPNAGTGRDVKATAEKRAGSFVLNGEKWLITNADFADLFMVLCHTDKSQGRHGLSALLVERDAPGFRNEEMADLMGCRGAGHGSLSFENCVVPADMLIGEEGQGLDVFLGELEPSRVFVAASSLGAAERAFELARDFARERVTFGKPIAEREMVRSYLADMAIDIHALRLMLDDAARKLDAGQPIPVEASICKTFGAEAVCRVTEKAMLIFGGRAYTAAYPIERLYRDARINLLEEGTPTIQRMVIARTLLDGYAW